LQSNFWKWEPEPNFKIDSVLEPEPKIKLYYILLLLLLLLFSKNQIRTGPMIPLYFMFLKVEPKPELRPVGQQLRTQSRLNHHSFLLWRLLLRLKEFLPCLVASNVAIIAQFDKGMGEDMECSFQGGNKLFNSIKE